MTSEAFRTNPLFLRGQCRGGGVFELPVIKKEEISLEEIRLIGYDKLYREDTEKIVHFFLDDYKFESLWNQPDSKIERLRQYRAVLSPQFSVYTEMPLPLQLYNIFRSRWCGAYLQMHGVTVIPTVYWGRPQTFWFCFEGIEAGSVVAISTLGVRKEKDLFLQGYAELMNRVHPKAVICYGRPFPEMTGKIIEIDYAQTNGLSGGKSAGLRFLKGMGSAGGGNSMPKNNSQLMHLFRKKDGHLPNTPENRALILRVANDEKNYLGTDARGHQWYAEMNPNGTQVWASVRGGIIQNCGLNDPPHSWDPVTGLNHNPFKSGGEFDAYII